MPMYSKRQNRYMWANHPRIAKKMVAGMKGKHPIKPLPERSRKKK